MSFGLGQGARFRFEIAWRKSHRPGLIYQVFYYDLLPKWRVRHMQWWKLKLESTDNAKRIRSEVPITQRSLMSRQWSRECVYDCLLSAVIPSKMELLRWMRVIDTGKFVRKSASKMQHLRTAFSKIEIVLLLPTALGARYHERDSVPPNTYSNLSHRRSGADQRYR